MSSVVHDIVRDCRRIPKLATLNLSGITIRSRRCQKTAILSDPHAQDFSTFRTETLLHHLLDMYRDLTSHPSDSDLTLAVAFTTGSAAFPAEGPLAGRHFELILYCGDAHRNTTHFVCPFPSVLVIADLMIIGVRSVTYTFVAPLGWGEICQSSKTAKPPGICPMHSSLALLGLLAYKCNNMPVMRPQTLLPLCSVFFLPSLEETESLSSKPL
jgi:hypothetical protein